MSDDGAGTPLHLALAFHDSGSYFLHAAATLLGVLERASIPPHIHILHDVCLPGRGIRLLKAVAAHRDAEIRFHLVPPLPAALTTRMPEAFGPGAFYRYFLPHLPGLADVARVIYLDCDICALTDIADLRQAADTALDADADGDGAPVLAGVLDATAPSRRGHLHRMGLVPRLYVNSGVLVLDLPRIRRHLPSLPQSMALALARMPASPYPDQDALNSLLLRLPFRLLDERFNFQLHVDGRWEWDATRLEGRLAHYCGRKPWCEPAPTSAAPFLAQYAALERLLAG